MTQYEQLKKLLTEFGVGFEERKIENEKLIDIETGEELSEDIKYISCREGFEKVEGYTCFYTMFYFDADGKFMYMGAWE